MSHNYDTSSRAVTQLGGRNTANEDFNHLTVAGDIDQFFSWLREAIPGNIWVPESPIELLVVALVLSCFITGTIGFAMIFQSKLGRIAASTIAAVGFSLALVWMNTKLLEAGGLL